MLWPFMVFYLDKLFFIYFDKHNLYIYLRYNLCDADDWYCCCFLSPHYLTWRLFFCFLKKGGVSQKVFVVR